MREQIYHEELQKYTNGNIIVRFFVNKKELCVFFLCREKIEPDQEVTAILEDTEDRVANLARNK